MHFTSPIRRYADVLVHRRQFPGNFGIQNLTVGILYGSYVFSTHLSSFIYGDADSSDSFFFFSGITILYLWCASLGNQDSQHQQLPRRTLGPGLQVGSYSRHWHQYWEAYGAKSSGAAHIESRGCPIPYEMFYRRFQTCISYIYIYFILYYII